MMKLLPLVVTCIASITAFAADPLPTLDVSITKYFGTTRSEEIMLNRVVPYSGAHLGGVHVDTSKTPNRFYIFDAGNNRILGYRGFKPVTLPNGPYPEPDIVIGQPAMWDSGAANGDNTHFLNPTASTLALLPFPYVNSTMEAPRSGMMATDKDGNFYIVDLCNNRVLKYNDPFATDQVADMVWGQHGFTTRDRGCSVSRIRTDWNYGTTIGTFAAGVDVDAAGNVWVVDSGNNRVLRFSPDARDANLVLGQQSFTSSSVGSGLNQMYHPTGVRVHPVTGELYVLDGQMDGGFLCRMLVFKPPFSRGMSADRQFGRKLGDEASGLSWSRGFAFDPDDDECVWILDGDHCRVVKYNSTTGDRLDVIGVKTINDASKWGGTYTRYNSTPGAIRQPDGSCGFDSDGNFYFTSCYGTSPIIRIPMPLQHDAQGWVKSDGEMMKDGMNQITGRTFNDFYGMALNGTQLSASSGNKILVWTNYPAMTTFSQADLVIGQDSFDTDQYGGSVNRAGYQCSASNLLFVVADWNWKIYIYKTPLTEGGRYKYPYKTLSSNGNVYWDDNSASVQFQANGLAYDASADCLWISDYQHNRILRVRNPLGEAKVDMVLGQTSKAGVERNHGIGNWDAFDYTTDAYGFGAPWSLALDNYRNLYVVDSGYEGRHDNAGNIRVTRFAAADLVPNPTNIFPFPAADGVFAKPNLTTQRTWSESHRPVIPTFIDFNASNHMIMGCGSYGNPQGERVFIYPTPHIGLAPQPTKIVDTYVGQVAAAYLDDAGSIVIQDHTWNRIIFHSPSATAPQIDITNGISTVYGTATAALGGTANSNIAGNIFWSNEQGSSGSIAAQTEWAIPSISLEYGPNLITVSGTNNTGVLASDTVTITREPHLPYIDITNTVTVVEMSTDTIILAGTNSAYTVGAMNWMNLSTTNAAGTIPASIGWTITNIPVVLGTNLIEVTGTNIIGRLAVDSLIVEVIPEPVLGFLFFNLLFLIGRKRA